MAGDWTKMRTDLYRDPKVSVIADHLLDKTGSLAEFVDQNMQREMSVTRNVMRNAAVGALVSVWGVMRQRGKRHEVDLVCDGVTLSVLDDIADLPGFGEAMAHARWVVATDTGIEFPRFFEDYNVDPDEKGKSKGAERQRRYRERHKDESDAEVTRNDNVTHNVTVTHREEKRREEKTTPKAPKGAALRFEEFWQAWPKSDRKGGKVDCLKHWTAFLLDSKAEEILTHVRLMRASTSWTKDGGQFIPAPLVYLRGARWDGAEVGEGARSTDDVFAGAI
jgi:hypothetical protein